MGVENIKLFEKQDSLGFLPVPKLDTTLERYLASVECLLTKEEFEKTKALAHDFAKTSGVKLQQLLEERAAKVNAAVAANRHGNASGHPDGSPYPHNSWLEFWWETYAYASDRMSLAVNINCFQSHFNARPCDKPLARGAWLIKSGLVGMEKLQGGSFAPEMAGKQALCSAQYHRLFATSRIPQDPADRLESHPESRHVCVERHGHFYLIPDVDKLSATQIEKMLGEIKQDADARPMGPGIDILTADTRDQWAIARDHLMGLSAQNKNNLSTMESAVFHLVLSEEKPRDRHELHHIGQHGKGIFYDKSMTHIVCENGAAISNLEHSSADAVVPARLWAFMNEFTDTHAPKGVGYPTDIKCLNLSNIPLGLDTVKQAVVDSFATDTKWKRLDFDVDGKLQEMIKHARKTLDDLIEDNIVRCLEFKDFGAKTISKNCPGISTDSFMQMALALAFYRDQNKQMPVAYETASTRGFFHGRTETIRPQSVFMKQFLEAFDDKSVPRAQVADLIRKAADHHRNYLRNCMRGEGVDRHLMAMRLLSAENGIPLHPLFTDKAYQVSTVFVLSTSQMPWAVQDWPGFGAYDPRAYACCYRFTSADTIVATVASRKTHPDCGNKDANRFEPVIMTALRDLLDVLSKNPPAQKAKL